MDREDPERWWRSWVDDVVDADENLRREINEFWANTPRAAKVGSRHHTVPKFYLKRFASKGRLLVRDRNSGEITPRNIDDLATKNFYTFVNKDGEEDSRLEDILADMEGGTGALLNRVFGAFQPVRQLNPGESMALALYLSFQVVRTPRHRREMELLADHSMKLVNQDKLPNPTEWVVVPHPNLHIGYMASTAFQLTDALYGRPVTLVTLDRPLFITCDEPVILVVKGDHVQHLPACFKTTKQRIKAAKRPSRHRRRNWDVLHYYPSRPGLGQAEEVGLPISPRSILVLGSKTSPAPLHVRLNGDDATEFADDVNRRLIDQAYIWVAANPDHVAFADLEFPPPKPILQACDGGTAMARALDQPPEKRHPERLSNRWRRGREPTQPRSCSGVPGAWSRHLIRNGPPHDRRPDDDGQTTDSWAGDGAWQSGRGSQSMAGPLGGSSIRPPLWASAAASPQFATRVGQDVGDVDADGLDADE